MPQDFAQAFNWYKLAADAGDREAQFALGMMLDAGPRRQPGSPARRRVHREGRQPGPDRRHVQSRPAAPRRRRAHRAIPSGRRSFSPPRRSRAAPMPNMRWPSSTPPAIRRPRRTIRSPPSGTRPPPGSASCRRRSTTPSGSSTAPASPRTRRRRRCGSSAPPQTGDPDRPEPPRPHPRHRRRACRPTRSTRPSGTILPASAGKQDEWLDSFVAGLSEPSSARRPPTRRSAGRADEPTAPAA